MNHSPDRRHFFAALAGAAVTAPALTNAEPFRETHVATLQRSVMYLQSRSIAEIQDDIDDVHDRREADRLLTLIVERDRRHTEFRIAGQQIVMEAIQTRTAACLPDEPVEFIQDRLDTEKDQLKVDVIRLRMNIRYQRSEDRKLAQLQRELADHAENTSPQ
jgi:hypothetical protein